jgi:flagellar hook-basal body complex protein FliE
MANLTVENIVQMIRSGDTEGLMSGGSSIQPTVAPEAKVLQEMAKEGLTPTSESSSATGFGKMLSESIEKVNQYQADSDRAVKELVAGRNKNIHETMLTMERADTSLKLMMQVRNKVLEAYREIMKMQI